MVTWVSEAGYRRLWAGVRDWNAASRRVLDKLGFRETGRVEPDAVYGDSLLTVREFERCPVADPSRDAGQRRARLAALSADCGWASGKRPSPPPEGARYCR